MRAFYVWWSRDALPSDYPERFAKAIIEVATGKLRHARVTQATAGGPGGRKVRPFMALEVSSDRDLIDSDDDVLMGAAVSDLSAWLRKRARYGEHKESYFIADIGSDAVDWSTARAAVLAALEANQDVFRVDHYSWDERTEVEEKMTLLVIGDMPVWDGATGKLERRYMANANPKLAYVHGAYLPGHPRTVRSTSPTKWYLVDDEGVWTERSWRSAAAAADYGRDMIEQGLVIDEDGDIVQAFDTESKHMARALGLIYDDRFDDLSPQEVRALKKIVADDIYGKGKVPWSWEELMDDVDTGLIDWGFLAGEFINTMARQKGQPAAEAAILTHAPHLARAAGIERW